MRGSEVSRPVEREMRHLTLLIERDPLLVRAYPQPAVIFAVYAPDELIPERRYFFPVIGVHVHGIEPLAGAHVQRVVISGFEVRYAMGKLRDGRKPVVGCVIAHDDAPVSAKPAGGGVAFQN